MKKINVVCGALIRDHKVMIGMRNYGSAKGYFEFPGGKVEANESLEEALIREWKEECEIDIQDITFLSENIDYQDGYEIHLYCFTFTSLQEPKLNVHSMFIWTTPDKIFKYNYFKADTVLVEKLKEAWPCLQEQMKKKY